MALLQNNFSDCDHIHRKFLLSLNYPKWFFFKKICNIFVKSRDNKMIWGESLWKIYYFKTICHILNITTIMISVSPNESGWKIRIDLLPNGPHLGNISFSFQSRLSIRKFPSSIFRPHIRPISHSATRPTCVT